MNPAMINDLMEIVCQWIARHDISIDALQEVELATSIRESFDDRGGDQVAYLHVEAMKELNTTMLAALTGLVSNPGIMIGNEKDPCIRAYRYAIIMEYIKKHIHKEAGSMFKTDNPSIEELYGYLKSGPDLAGELSGIG
jgi:hypothetical protein